MWTLKLSPQAAEFYELLTGKHKKQVENAFNLLAQDPRIGKILKGDLRGFWSYRVGFYRIIYVVRNQEVVVEILRIHHRKEVYEKFRR